MASYTEVELPVGIEHDGTRYRTVIIDEMTGLDEENIADRKHKNNGALAMTALLRRCIIEVPGLVKKNRPSELLDSALVRSMYVADRDFLFFKIREASLESPDIDYTVTCPSCSAKNSVSIDLSTLEILDWDEDEPTTFELTMPVGFENESGELCNKVVWKLPTGVEQERIASQGQDKAVTSMLSACIVSVEGMERKPNSEAIRRLRTRDRLALLEAVNEFAPGLDLSQSYDCYECGNEWEANLDFASFFNTASEKTESKRSSLGAKKLKKRSRTK